MPYSKKYIRERIFEFMKNPINDSGIGYPNIDELEGLCRQLDPDHIKGFNADGIVWNNSKDDCRRDMNIENIRRVAAILLLVCWTFFIDTGDEFRTRTRTRFAHTSYGLKHSVEHIRKKKGDDNIYVSNGEFIGGYLYFLYNVMGLKPRSLKSLAWPDHHGLNLFMKVPKGFDIIDDYCRGLL